MLEITTRIGDQTYTGKYEVTGNVITVHTSAGSKSTQVGQSSVVPLARMLLGEIVREGKG